MAMRTSTRAHLEWAADVLRAQDMPPEEIRAILATDDVTVVRRYLELHVERLEERLAADRRTIRSLEATLGSMKGSAPGVSDDRSSSAAGFIRPAAGCSG